jgi:ABC-type glutathione transport system ATPase component
MSGERNRENARERSRHVSADVREIGPLPKVAHPKLRKKAEADPVYFLKRYFPQRFYLGFGKPHLSAIDTIEKCIRKGGLHAFAMQRGGGKTTLTEPMLLRALLYGFRRYVVFIGATDPLATAGVKRMQRELETNDLLLADFPEVCYPIRRLERITQRARGQTLDGKPTNMEFTDGHFVLPSVSRSKASGGVVQAFGVTGAIKGLQRLLPDGGIIRPDLVLLDEPCAGVNPSLVGGISTLLKELNQTRKGSFVVIEHNMDFVMDLCHRIMVMVEGQVMAIGTPAEIRANKQVLDAYLGS